MPKLATGIFGVIAVSLTCGAVQFAAGRDLASLQDPLQISLENSSGAPEAAINRAAKADRAAGAAGSTTPTRTISLRLDGLADTSILVRIPFIRELGNKEVGKEARKGSSTPFPLLTKAGKMTVACEPVVSALTEVAKRLQPGRCIT